MSMREEMLTKIREAVANKASQTDRMKAVEERIQKHPVSTQPQTLKNSKDILALFIEKAEAAEATITQCKKSKVEAEIIDYMRKHNLPLSLRMGEDKRLASYKIGKDKMLEIAYGPSDGNDLVTVSHAFGSAAETGTLALVSGKENPTTLNFLAQDHIVILDKKDVLLHQEDIWNKLRGTYGEGVMPRTLNFITGPSRSADIQQTLILGAHGPLRLHIIIVD